MIPGTLFADRFEIEREAGSGGMGTVYRARDRLDGAAVAVKLLHAQGEQETRRFVREGKILAELKHPGIVRYVAHGVSPAGEAWLAMEWLEGEDLGRFLGRELPSVRAAVALARRVAEILAVAHAKGIVHRDLKPPNLFLEDGRLDRVKVVDFGIARVDAGTRATRTGMMIGTPGYMAPEQARGDRALDARADVFALGCVLFECLTGRAPFAGDHVMAVLAKILLEEAPRASDVRSGLPDALDDLVARMVAKKPEARPSDGAAVVAEIDALGDVGDLPFTASILPTAALTAGEQRLLSVVLLGTAAPEVAEVAATLTPEQEEAPLVTLRAAAEAYGGTIERLVDGSIVAVLSGTGAATDQAARAARCALAMRSVAREGAMALVTGLGEVAGRWPVGEVVDRAAPLLRAGGTRIHVDEVTAGLLGVRFEVRREGEGLVLHGEREVVEGVRTLLGKETPCVGRERELGVLTGLWEECVEEPVARPVLVTAPPGVGKSRLRWEFLHRLEEREDGAAVWIGRGDPMSAGSPFGMLAQAIRGACGVRDGEPIQVRQSKVRARVAKSVTGPDHQRVTEFLGELAGVSFPDDDSVQLRAARQNAIIMGDQMRRAWEDFLAAETAAHPVLLVLEDLHWGDLPTVTFVDAALRNLRDRPMMVLATARPEVEELFPRLWAERRLQEIRLDELSKRASEKLVRAVVPDVGAETMARILERAAGNAFFLEELVRAEVQGQGAEAPGSVLAMVQARLEALDPESRRVLRAASVFGQVAWKGGVVKLLGGDRREAETWLPELVDAEILVRRGEGRFPGEEEFAFRHALVRDAAYGMLTEHDRTLGHRLAGDWLEETGEREALVLAEHFERGKQPERAIGWYTKAATDALQGNDFVAVIARAERAITSGAQGGDLGALRLLQAEAHRWMGDDGDARAEALRAKDLFGIGTPGWYGAVGELVIALGQLGERDALAPLGRELATVIDARESTGPQVGAAARAATQLLAVAHVDLAEPLLARILEVRPAVLDESPASAAWIDFALAQRASRTGNVEEFVRRCEAAIESAVRAGDERYACLMRINCAFAHMEVGAFVRAEAELRRALTAAERMGLVRFIPTTRTNLGMTLARLGKLDEALVLERAAVDEFVARKQPRMEGGSRIYLATILLSSGQLAEAEHEAERAIEVLRVAPPLLPFACATLSRIRIRMQRAEAALTSARDASDRLAAVGGSAVGESVVRLALAEALAATGDADGAREAIRLAEARLLERSGRIQDPALRASFLEIEENAATLRLAADRT